jgi:hypothetical protein
MSTSVTIVTTDGRVVQGINYSLNASSIPTSDVSALTAAMPGGYSMGVYRILTANGWEYVPASQIGAISRFKAGAPT